MAPEYQGRVFTLMASLATAMTPVGLLLATPVADLAGVRAWYLAAGTVCAALGAAAFLVRPIAVIEGTVAASLLVGGTRPAGKSLIAKGLPHPSEVPLRACAAEGAREAARDRSS